MPVAPAKKCFRPANAVSRARPVTGRGYVLPKIRPSGMCQCRLHARIAAISLPRHAGLAAAAGHHCLKGRILEPKRPASWRDRASLLHLARRYHGKSARHQCLGPNEAVSKTVPQRQRLVLCRPDIGPLGLFDSRQGPRGTDCDTPPGRQSCSRLPAPTSRLRVVCAVVAARTMLSRIAMSSLARSVSLSVVIPPTTWTTC